MAGVTGLVRSEATEYFTWCFVGRKSYVCFVAAP